MRVPMKPELAIAIFLSFVSHPALDRELREAEIVSYFPLYPQPTAWYLIDVQ